MQPPTAATLWHASASLVLGLVVGALGTVMHRAMWPWGLLLCLLLVVVALLVARAWVGWYGYVAGVGGLYVAVQVLTSGGPGGDVLVPAGDMRGVGWLLGCLLAVVAVAFAPRRWVEDDGSAAP